MGGEAARVRVEGGARCPFCRDGLEKTAELVACAPCGARFHASCHASNQGRCPACGATDVLVPRRASRARGEPPSGSRIEVTRTPERTRFQWDSHGWLDVVLLAVFAVFVFTLPLAVLIFLARRRSNRAEVLLDDEALEFHASARLFGQGKRVRVRREELGGVRVICEADNYALTVDAGIVRHVVYTGIVASPLSPPELEWLAEQIRAWAAER